MYEPCGDPCTLLVLSSMWHSYTHILIVVIIIKKEEDRRVSPHALPPHSVLQRVPPFGTSLFAGASGYFFAVAGPHLPVCLLTLRWALCLDSSACFFCRVGLTTCLCVY